MENESGPTGGAASTGAVEITPIGRVTTPFAEKFGVPRQPGLAPSVPGVIELFPPFGTPDALRGLEGFSRLWIVFLAHLVPPGGEFSPTVRPPRLGGNARVGVFASRSLFRPNRLGLSLARLDGVEITGGGGARLRVSGLDLVNGTPVFDIKPYLPYVEAVLDARGGFAPAAPERVDVAFSPGATARCHAIEAGRPGFTAMLLEVVAADPRPAYQAGDSGRAYAMLLDGFTVRFRADGPGILVTDVSGSGEEIPEDRA